MKHITLPLAEDTTDLVCGSCSGASPVHENDAANWVVCDVFTDMISHDETRPGKRLRKCTDAEASLAALVRDAEAWRRVRSAVLTADRQRSIAAIVTGEMEKTDA